MFQDLLTDGVARVAIAPTSILTRRRKQPEMVGRSRRIVRGSSNMTECEDIRAFFTRCTKSIDDRAQLLVIDLGRVEQADTKLMACLVAVYQLARASSIRVELWSSQAVLDMIEFCKLRWLIDYAAIED